MEERRLVRALRRHSGSPKHDRVLRERTTRGSTSPLMGRKGLPQHQVEREVRETSACCLHNPSATELRTKLPCPTQESIGRQRDQAKNRLATGPCHRQTRKRRGARLSVSR